MQKTYGEHITIRKGLEFGVQQHTISQYNRLLKTYKDELDFVLLSIHQVEKIARYDPCGVYPFEKLQDILTEIFSVIIAKGKGIELNTSSWHYKLADTTPCREILRLYYQLGGRIITIGSDAHTPQYLADHAAEAQQILKEIGFSEIYTFQQHIPVSHKI